MDATVRTSALQHAVFEDGLGTRHHAVTPDGEPIEVLELRDEFSTEAFERALRQRVAALGGFRSTWFSQVRTVQRIAQQASKLFVVYDRVPGTRLTTVLGAAPQPLDVNATLCLIRQLVAAVALMHEKLPASAHGAIAPERVIITPKARLVVADHVLGSALDELRYSRDRYWNELRVPLPQGADATFDQRADVMQIGILALELILGHRISPGQYPDEIDELTERAWRESATGAKPLPAELRTWLSRMLQLDADRAFVSAVDAWTDLEHVLVGSDNRAAFLALESIVADSMRRAAAPEPPPAEKAIEKRSAPVDAPQETPVETPHTVPNDAPKLAPVAAAPPPIVTPAPRPQRAAPPVVPAAEATVTPAESSAPTLLHIQEDTDVNTTMPKRNRRWIAVAAVLVLLASGGAFFGRQYLMPSAAAEAPGTLVVTTNPPGFQVFIDGQPRGVTPLTLELAAGAHELRLATEGEPRIIPVTITPGSMVAQTLELPKAAPRTGQLSIRTDPPGASVTIDGTPSGTTPLTIEGLTPGVHSVALSKDLNSITQEVTVEAGTTASLVVPMTAPQGVPVSGWIAVDAPAEVQVHEDGHLLGSSRTDRIMVSAGHHTFEFVNETLGYRAKRTVTVSPGKVSAMRLDWPKGSLAVNAQPWADVWIGGQRIGETPIGNVTLPIGTHEVTFRHPQLGEQIVRATVTATSATRVSVDMRKR